MVKINNKGFTLLEALISLAILGIIIVSFLSLFSSTNININFSGKKVKVVREVKSILDEIHLKSTKVLIEDDEKLKAIVKEVLEDRGYRDDYIIFDNDKNFEKHLNKKIHCLIEEQIVDIKGIENSNNIFSNILKIKINFFYENGNRKVQLSNYVFIEEDENE